MEFIPIDTEYNSLSKDNLINLETNLLKIKYYYEEDQLEYLSSIPERILQEIYINIYMDYANEISMYIDILATLETRVETEITNKELIEIIIDYFLFYDEILEDKEIKNHKGFSNWLKNCEMYEYIEGE